MARKKPIYASARPKRLGKPKSYAKEPAILGLKNQYFMDRLLNFLKILIDKLATENTYVTGAPGGTSSPRKEVWEGINEDWDGEGGYLQ